MPPKCQWQNKVAGGKGMSETKSKQKIPCSKCMHRPVMSWGNPCSTCMHWPVVCMHRPVTYRSMHALTAWNLKFQVCLGYTFTPATLVSNSVALLSLDSLIDATTNMIISICYHIMEEGQGIQYHQHCWVHVCPLNSDNINTALNYGQLS